MKLRVGIPLATKNPQEHTNAVVYKVVEGGHRNVVWVISDFGNIMKFPSEEDVLQRYVISRTYEREVYYAGELDMGQEWLDGLFDIRDRLRHQIELLTEALEGLE